MKRKTMLFAVIVAGGAATVASADPATPTQVPRMLATGAPACGNVMFKGYVPPNPGCTVTRSILAFAQEGRKILQELPVVRHVGHSDRGSLTVAVVDRPRS